MVAGGLLSVDPPGRPGGPDELRKMCQKEKAGGNWPFSRIARWGFLKKDGQKCLIILMSLADRSFLWCLLALFLQKMKIAEQTEMSAENIISLAWPVSRGINNSASDL